MKKKGFCGVLTAALAAAMTAGLSMTALASPTDWSCTTTRKADGNILLDFEAVQVTLPASWEGLCQMGTGADSVSFYQKKSRTLYTEELGFPNGGWLFSVCWSDNFDFLELPSYEIIGNGSDGCYYLMYPTDVQGYVDDTEVYNEFRWMSEDVSWVAANITLKDEALIEVVPGESEYILPYSSTEYLSKSDLYGMDKDEIQMAINEIYARHHRKFVLWEVQDYFNSKSWYTGYIEAEDFDVSVMNKYESYNISLMVECMKAL